MNRGALLLWHPQAEELEGADREAEGGQQNLVSRTAGNELLLTGGLA